MADGRTLDWLEAELQKSGAAAPSPLTYTQTTDPGLAEHATWGARGANVGISEYLGLPGKAIREGLVTAGVEPGTAESVVPGTPEDIRWLQNQIARAMPETRFGYQPGAPGAYESIQEVPPGFRPAAYAGENVGPGGLMATTPFLGPVQRSLSQSPIVQTAARNPRAVASIEGGSLAGSAAGSALAERYAPGDTGLRTGAEIVFGFGVPGPNWGKVGLNARRLGSNIAARFSKGAREEQVGGSLRRAVEGAGEDVGQVIADLEGGPRVTGVRYPSAAQARSPTLMALQDEYMKGRPDLSNAVKDQMSEAARELDNAYRIAVESGDPQSIRRASELRQQFYRDIMQDSIRREIVNVEKEAQKFIADMRPEDASQAAYDAVRTSLSRSRDMERYLWSAVDGDTKIVPTGTRDAHATLRSEMTPEMSLPNIEGFDLNAFLKRAGNEDLTFRDIQGARSELLSQIDALKSTGNRRAARRLEILADGMLQDIGPLSSEARDYSRQLNQVFREPTVDRILGTTRSGQERVPQSKTLEEVFKGSRRDIASEAVETAAQFEGLTTSPMQNAFLREMARDVLTDTGEIDVNKLNWFRRRNRDVLSRPEFQDIDEALGSSKQAQQLLDTVREQAKTTERLMGKQAFAKMVGSERPDMVIRNILASDRPIAQYRDLIETARSSGPEAVDGLRGATFDTLFNLSNTGDMTSGKVMRDLLTRRSGTGENLLDVMTQSGVLNTRQRENLMRVVDEVENLENLLASGRQIDEILDGATALEDLTARLIGAGMGSNTALGGSGSSLVMAQAGSQRARQVMNEMPLNRAKDLISDAIKDPAVMARLLKKGRTEADDIELARFLNAYLMQTIVPESEGTPPLFEPMGP